MITSGMRTSNSTEWETPQELYDELDKEFDFNLDPCASETNYKCDRYFIKKQDGLSADWYHFRAVFMNPPYGRKISRWVQKAWEESQKGCIVVCLLPARTDTRWFHNYCLRGEIRFLKGRLYFIDQGGKTGRAPFPSMIVIFRSQKEFT